MTSNDLTVGVVISVLCGIAAIVIFAWELAQERHINPPTDIAPSIDANLEEHKETP